MMRTYGSPGASSVPKSDSRCSVSMGGSFRDSVSETWPSCQIPFLGKPCAPQMAYVCVCGFVNVTRAVFRVDTERKPSKPTTRKRPMVMCWLLVLSRLEQNKQNTWLLFFCPRATTWQTCCGQDPHRKTSGDREEARCGPGAGRGFPCEMALAMTLKHVREKCCTQPRHQLDESSSGIVSAERWEVQLLQAPPESVILGFR